jgi:hypothetical protein
VNLIDPDAFDADDDGPEVLRGPDGRRLTDAEMAAALDHMADAALADLRASRAAELDAYESLPWWRKARVRLAEIRARRRLLRDLRRYTNP